MATRKQKQELVDALKFTPRDVEISLSGYGGEIVIGTITEEVYDFWRDRDDLDELASDWDGELDVPADMRFITDGAWHDIDDLCHESGCEASASNMLQVWDAQENASIFECSTDLDALNRAGVSADCHWHRVPREDCEAGTCVFVGQSIEKGTFFSGTIRITAPFDPSKLAISWTDCDGWRLITGVEYDGEEVEGGDGYSTTGKGMEFHVHQVGQADEEPDYDHPEANFDDGYSMSGAGTNWIPADTKPDQTGEYDVLIDAPWPNGGPGRAEWTGRTWKSDGKKVKITQWAKHDDPYNIGVLEGEEMWASEAIDTAAEVQRWEGHPLTPWWPVTDPPAREGRYQVMLGTWPFPSFAEYSRKKGWTEHGEKINNVVSWRGLCEPAE